MDLIRYFVLAGIIIISCSVDAFACHNESHDPIIGHKDKFSINLTTVTTESTTAYISTSTQCKWYSQFIKEEYKLIVEEAAQGQGKHLNVLAQLIGCPTESHSEFAVLLQTQYERLFGEKEAAQPEFLLKKLKNLVAGEQTLGRACIGT